MLKKIFSLGSIILLVFAIAACGNDEEEEILNPSRGIWEDDTFTSEYLGLEFELPTGWEMLDDKDIAEFLGVVFNDAAPAMGVEIPDEVLEALEDEQFHDMYAIHPFSGSNVQIIFERSPLAMLISEEDYFETLIEQLEGMANMGMEFGDFEIASDTTTIGNYEWESLSTEIVLGAGIEMQSHTFVNIQGPNIRAIVITIGLGDETVDDILDAFSTIN